MSVRIAAALIWLPMAALAQGFAGLGTTSDGFATPVPGYQFSFPQDLGPHPDFRIEWWYLTANLTGPDGTDYGLQWTLFRTALAPGDAEGWQSPQLWMGHAAITTPDQHFVTERLARGGIGQAGVVVAPFEAWIDDWQMVELDGTSRLRASGPDFSYDLTMRTAGPLVLHGDQGYSVKSGDGQASYYYSQPFLRLSGSLYLPEGDVAVTGQGWLDREWSSQPLAADQTGWDWFSLGFDDGSKLMGFRLRRTDKTSYASATWIDADGTTITFPDGAFIATPGRTHTVAGHIVPVAWRVQLPEKGIDVTIEAINPDAWMATSVPYWEGPVRISGNRTGRGYLEMTGYD
jgi:predicted secreted hydrolase